MKQAKVAFKTLDPGDAWLNKRVDPLA